MVFLSQKVDGNIIFTDYWKVLVLIFSEMGSTVFSWAKKFIEIWYLLITEKVLFWTFRWWKIRPFFESRSWWKDDIYWLLRSSCFELFGDGKCRLFFSQKVDRKMIFTWSFWAFYDIPGPAKYSISRSVNNNTKDDDDNVDSIEYYDRDDTDNNVNYDDLTMIAQISLHISMERF